MNLIKKCYYRSFQFILRLASYFINFREPSIINKENAIFEIKNILKSNKKNNVFLITGNIIKTTTQFNNLVNDLKNNNVNVTIFSNVINNPTIENVEEGLEVFLANQCDSIIAVGGGSVIDFAKLVASRATNKKPIEQMKGLLKVKHKPSFLIVVPTTAGTGSEVTIASVVTNDITHQKYAINDPKLIPLYAVLDPVFLLSAPNNITSTTGMDALTHAIEAYIGRSNTKKTKKEALIAIKLIFDNLYKSYANPNDIEAKSNMQIASLKAGLAFTRAYVGYVHALAHALGAKYNISHGLANAILLPEALKKYGKHAYKPLSEISDYLELTKKDLSKKEKAETLISAIENLNKSMNINNVLKSIIKIEDINFLVNHAYKEANPLYPVPYIWDKKDFKDLYLSLLK